MGALVVIKLGPNCCERNVDATTYAKMDSDLDVKRRQNWIQNKMQKWM